MNTVYKTALINVLITVLLVLLLTATNGDFSRGDFAVGLGLISLGIALLDILVSIILFIAGQQNREMAKGFLLSAGVLLLMGFVACSASFA